MSALGALPLLIAGTRGGGAGGARRDAGAAILRITFGYLTALPDGGAAELWPAVTLLRQGDRWAREQPGLKLPAETRIQAVAIAVELDNRTADRLDIELRVGGTLATTAGPQPLDRIARETLAPGRATRRYAFELPGAATPGSPPTLLGAPHAGLLSVRRLR